MYQNKTAIFSSVILTSILFLSSCGTSKNGAKSTSTNNFASESQTGVLASCNKKVTSDLSFNTTIVQDQIGQADPNWIKLKINMLSAKVTASGNIIKFFKWKVVNGQAILDQNPLALYVYDLSTGYASAQASSFIVASQVTATKGYFVGLNDPQSTFQVIKMVVYSNSGSVVAHEDSLIPQFTAQPALYQTNKGSILSSLHPLINTNTSSWSDAQYKSYFQNFCF